MGSQPSKEEKTVFSSSETTTTTTTTKDENQQRRQDVPYCPDCEKSQQKPLPNEDTVSSEGQPCDEIYRIVDMCMKQNNGQISSCTKEWTDFQECHVRYKEK